MCVVSEGVRSSGVGKTHQIMKESATKTRSIVAVPVHAV